MKGESVPYVVYSVGRFLFRTLGHGLSAMMEDNNRSSVFRIGILAAVGVILCKILGIAVTRWSVSAVLLAVLSLTTDFLNYLYVFFVTLPRDFKGLCLLINLKWSMYRFVKDRMSIPTMFRKYVRLHPNKPCFVYEDTVWTYKQVDDYSNAIANMFWDAGFRHGDVVALFLESRPEFPCVWLGLAKIGVVTALINFNLRMQPLIHSITTANAKAVIFGTELTEAVDDIRKELPTDMIYYHSGKGPEVPFSAIDIDVLMKTTPITEPPKTELNPSDRLVFIYTSGTTGLPKAAVITNIRYYFLARGVTCAMKVKKEDIIYDSLPLYHSAGGALGIGQALTNGNTVVIRRKFSASRFWDDCIKHNCTIAQYIGEICRYLLAQPPRPVDRAHKVRLMFGNGMRPQIWESFVNRFGVKQISELYGATEGNANIVNTENRVGAIGFLSRIAPFAYPCWLIKVDEETGEPLRNKKGMAIFCKPGEPGEFVGKIMSSHPERTFDGYVSKSANKKKLIHDVWKKGDTAFISGDLLVMDNFGYLYFKDRTGDTFRWKGENVSTAEVEAVISNAIGLKDSVVYGVEIPGTEGRAGMAAILDPEHKVDLTELATSLQRSLAPYARPLFVRIMDSLPMTGTYKLKKIELQEDGFNPAKCLKDKLYYYHRNVFHPLNEKAYSDICQGAIQL